MFDKILDTYNISLSTLKEIFPEHIGAIDRIAGLTSADLSSQDREDAEMVAIDFISSLSGYKNEKRIMDYLSTHPEVIGRLEEKKAPQMISKPQEKERTIETAEADEAEEVLMPPLKKGASSSRQTIEPAKPETPPAPPAIMPPAPTEEKKIFNDIDNLYYENFKLDSLPKLIGLMRESSWAYTGIPVEYKINGVSTDLEIAITKDVRKWLQEQGLLGSAAQGQMELGRKVQALYSKCFPVYMHPFAYVYKSRAAMFPNYVMDVKVSGALFININGHPFIYNGSSLLEKADDNFDDKDNVHDLPFEKTIHSILKRAATQSCSPYAYCLDIVNSQFDFNIRGGDGLGHILFDLYSSGQTVDALTFNYLRFRYGMDLTYHFHYTAKESATSLISVFKNGKVVAVLISDKAAEQNVYLTAKWHGISDEWAVRDRIHADFPNIAQLVEFDEFLKRDGGYRNYAEQPAAEKGGAAETGSMGADAYKDAIEAMRVSIKYTKDKKEKKKIQETIDDLKAAAAIIFASKPEDIEQIQKLEEGGEIPSMSRGGGISAKYFGKKGAFIKKIAEENDIDIEGFRLNYLAHGYEVEMEHGSKAGKDLNVTHDDPATTLKIVMGHLLERSDYYIVLEKAEKSKPTADTKSYMTAAGSEKKELKVGDEGMFRGGEYRIMYHSPSGEYRLSALDENGKIVPGKKTRVREKRLKSLFAKFPKDKVEMGDGGHIGFEGLSKKVSKEYRGKGYSKSEADEIGKKTAGKVYQQQQRMEAGGEMARGGTFEDNLEKELHRLQRDLNSSRLNTHIEGDNSEEEMARVRERAAKLARFEEVLRLLREKDGKKYEAGGEIKPKFRYARRGEMPSAYGDIVRIKNPNPDEDPSLRYVVVQDNMEEYGPDDQIDCMALGTGMAIAPIDRIEIKDLVVETPGEIVQEVAKDLHVDKNNPLELDMGTMFRDEVGNKYTISFYDRNQGGYYANDLSHGGNLMFTGQWETLWDRYKRVPKLKITTQKKASKNNPPK